MIFIRLSSPLLSSFDKLQIFPLSRAEFFSGFHFVALNLLEEFFSVHAGRRRVLIWQHTAGNYKVCSLACHSNEHAATARITSFQLSKSSSAAATAAVESIMINRSLWLFRTISSFHIQTWLSLDIS
jgi:hypothetical protein